jgi:hypothetical protein
MAEIRESGTRLFALGRCIREGGARLLAGLDVQSGKRRSASAGLDVQSGKRRSALPRAWMCNRESGARLYRGLAPGIPLGGRMPTAALRALRPRRPPCHPARFARPRMGRSAPGSLRDRRTGRWPLSRLASSRAKTLAALVYAASENPRPPARRAWLRPSVPPDAREPKSSSIRQLSAAWPQHS